jgi:nucleoside-diphosphate-sugar epimerase
VTLRYFNVFGPRQNPLSQYAGVIPLFTRRLLQGQPPQVFGDGTQTRDFTFVENVVRATLAACTAARVTGRVFNVAAGSPVSVLELLRILGEILSTSLRPDFHPARTGDVLHSHAAIDSAREALGYQPSVSFRDGLERTVATLRGEPPERA